MSDKFNGRTPDEIKKRLEKPCEDKSECKWCIGAYHCGLEEDALTLIRQLERERDEAYRDIDLLDAQVTALEGAYEAMKHEREVLVRSLKRKLFGCEFCKHYLSKSGSLCGLPIEKRQPSFNCWEWRGIEKGDEKQ